MGLSNPAIENGADGTTVSAVSPNWVTTKLDFLTNWARSNSLWPMPFGTACCAIEFMATAASRFDLARFGMERISFSPRQADVLIVAGPRTAFLEPEAGALEKHLAAAGLPDVKVGWRGIVDTADEAAQQLEEDGISVEILDLRTLIPWDKQAVLESVAKTSKVIVLHEDTHTGGFGGEIAATIAEEAFEDLDAPLSRITAPDTPVPFSPPLEKAFIPQVEDVVAGIRELAEY